MKKLLLIVLLIPVITYGQKAPKPNTKKILSLYQEGKYKEAKEQADITVADPKLGTDAYAWYHRGLVYATLDTIPDAALHALDPDPLAVAVESFKKAEQFNKKKDNELFILPMGSLEPIKKKDQLEFLANHYLSKGIKLQQQDEPDYSGSYAWSGRTRFIFENTMDKYRYDTTTYYVQANAALNLKHYDSAKEAGYKFIERGGTDREIYLILFQAYDEADDKDGALKVMKEARKKFPFEKNFAQNELSIYLKTSQFDAAKAMVEEQIQTSPSAYSYYMLGELNKKLGNPADAVKAYTKALELDINDFDANAAMAESSYEDVQKVRAQRDATKDTEKRRVLYQQIEKELKKTLVYWERLESIRPNDEVVLNYLKSLYNDLSTYDDAKYTPKHNSIKAKMKSLGFEVD